MYTEEKNVGNRVIRFQQPVEEFDGDNPLFGYSEEGLDFPMGIESIHRYKGEFYFKGYTFIGEGDKDERLTFCILDVGYVYLRGKGIVRTKDGKERRFGY